MRYSRFVTRFVTFVGLFEEQSAVFDFSRGRKDAAVRSLREEEEEEVGKGESLRSGVGA